MRLLLVPIVLAVAMPATAASGDIPLVAIGLPFSPDTPQPVAPAHPLFRRPSIAGVDGLSGVVGSSRLNFIGAAKGSSIMKSLRETFARMNMLAPDDASARARLSVTWLGARAPFRVGTRNEGTATLSYRLSRIDDGRVIFEREITTSARGGGADAGLRDVGVVRAAIAANFASAANCIERAAYDDAPGYCALTPRFPVSVVRRLG